MTKLLWQNNIYSSDGRLEGPGLGLGASPENELGNALWMQYKQNEHVERCQYLSASRAGLNKSGRGAMKCVRVDDVLRLQRRRASNTRAGRSTTYMAGTFPNTSSSLLFCSFDVLCCCIRLVRTPCMTFVLKSLTYSVIIEHRVMQRTTPVVVEAHAHRAAK